MKIIFIRHGHKQYKNGKCPKYKRQHDPPLSKKGIKQIENLARDLERKEKPEVVLCSPYYRTKETFHILNDCLDISPIVSFEPNLSEFLGNQNFTDRTLITEKYVPPDHTETMEEFDERIQMAIEDLERLKQRGVSTIWVVSHGFTIQKIIEGMIRVNQPYYYLKEGEKLELNI